MYIVYISIYIYVYGTAAPIYTWHAYMEPYLVDFICDLSYEPARNLTRTHPQSHPKGLDSLGYVPLFTGGSIYDKPKQCTKRTIHLHCLIPPKWVISWSLINIWWISPNRKRCSFSIRSIYVYILILVTIYTYNYKYKYVCVCLFICFVSKFHVLDT